MPYFANITLLVTHYNRSQSLERLLQTFQEQSFNFENIVVSDDGSRPDHLIAVKALQHLYYFTLVTTPVNRGLGHNINKGQDAVTTPYTLYVQEDFVPQKIFLQKLEQAYNFMKERSELDVVRFYAYFKYPFLKPYHHGFSEMKFTTLPFLQGYRKFYYYSDHPHLRRSDFLQKFGRYDEGRKSDVTEYRMMISFLQKKGRALFYEDYKGLFDQENSAIEPSTVKRNYWRQAQNPLVALSRHMYRHLKFNIDYHFMRFHKS